MKKPSFQFYPGDWRKDQNLSRASLKAKGALIEILCLAFECEKRGYLKTGKNPWTVDEIAHAMGGDKMENVSAIEELLTKKILKIDKKNTIFSARMVRDEKLSKVRREAGSKGGNPNLLNQKPKQIPTPSSSSSSSSSETTVVVGVNEMPFFEMFKRASGHHFTDQVLVEETRKFMNKYPAVRGRGAASIINTWVNNMHEAPSKQNGVIKNSTFT